MAAVSIVLEFSLFFKNVAFSEMIREFDAFCERAGRPNLRTSRFFDPRGSREEKKFKNPYAGWIWAASGTSLFGTAVDLVRIFAFF